MIARLTLALCFAAAARAQRTDTVVKRADKPVHAGIATLQREITIGVANGDDHYMMGAIADIAVGRNGDIYVWDRAVPAIRMYDAAGKFVKNIGHQGSGPGEYRNGSALAVAPNGNLLMWDPGNARINLYTAAGDVIDSWPTLSGGSGAAFGRGLLMIDTAGVAYIRTITVQPRGAGQPGDVKTIRLRFSRTGKLMDTLFAPEFPREATLTAASGKGQFSELLVPFMPTYHAPLSPLGYFVTGYSDRIALDVHEPGKPITSIRRDAPRAPVTTRERDSARTAITDDMKQVQPNWSWNGPDIPRVRPAYTSPYIDQNGRIWIELSEGPRRKEDSTSANRGDEMMIQSKAGAKTPAIPWSCPASGATLFDVYEPRGVYLGQVRIHERMDPIITRGDYIWGVTCDDDDVPSVGRYRIVWR